MRLVRVFLAGLAATVGACSTPYRPAVAVAGGHAYPGVVDIVASSGGARVDLVLVHGMCTHALPWVDETAQALAGRLDAVIGARTGPTVETLGGAPAIETRTLDVAIGGTTVHVTGIVWSRLTEPHKATLADDRTGTPTDCSRPGECRPVRASLNAELKDGLMNDCLADALVYQGRGATPMRDGMVQALTQVFRSMRAAADAERRSLGPVVIVAESLGSKLAFDALETMLESRENADLAQDVRNRLRVVFLAANQIPLLRLADPRQATPGAAPRAPDSMLRFLAAPRRMRALGATADDPVDIVAFTDPNDLLSYRLAPGFPATGSLRVSDILVSNAGALLGKVAHPWHVHVRYLENPDVIRAIACGPPPKACR